MILAIIIGSVLSLASGALIFLTKKRRSHALTVALPFGAGALLAAAFFDVLPESFEHSDPEKMLVWALAGFLAFFLFERLAGWFHHHHTHDHYHPEERGNHQNQLVVAGDLMHNMIDGIAIGAAFLANPMTGIVATIAISAHEIPKELGTFGILLSRGWKDKKVLLANVATALGTLVAASAVYLVGTSTQLPESEILALAAGFFLYVAASDIIPEIHEQSKIKGTVQAVILLASLTVVAMIVQALGV